MATSSTRRNAVPRTKRPGSLPGYHGQAPYDQESCLTKIFNELSTSDKGLHKILNEDPNLPTAVTFWNWLSADTLNHDALGIAARYTRAKKLQAEFMENQLLEIVDSEPSSTDKGNVDGADVKHKELRAKTRQWLMGRLDSKKYGDRQMLTGDPDQPLAPAADLSKLTDAELALFMAMRAKISS